MIIMVKMELISEDVGLVDIVDFLTVLTDYKICKTKGEVRRLLKQGGLYINKERISPDTKWMVYKKNDGKWSPQGRLLE